MKFSHGPRWEKRNLKHIIEQKGRQRNRINNFDSLSLAGVISITQSFDLFSIDI